MQIKRHWLLVETMPFGYFFSGVNTPASGSQQAARALPKGSLRLLSAMTAKSISEVKPSNKRGAHHFSHFTQLTRTEQAFYPGQRKSKCKTSCQVAHVFMHHT